MLLEIIHLFLIWTHLQVMSQHHLPWSIQWRQKQQKDKEKEKSFNVVDLTVMGDIIKTKAKVVEDLTHVRHDHNKLNDKEMWQISHFRFLLETISQNRAVPK